jgi:hypothetical protein
VAEQSPEERGLLLVEALSDIRELHALGGRQGRVSDIAHGGPGTGKTTERSSHRCRWLYPFRAWTPDHLGGGRHLDDSGRSEFRIAGAGAYRAAAGEDGLGVAA